MPTSVADRYEANCLLPDNTSSQVAVALIVMAIVVHTAHRTQIHRVAWTWLLLPLVGLLVLLYVTDAVAVGHKVHAILAKPTTSLRSPTGIAAVCRELQGVASQNFTAVMLLIVTAYLFLQTFCIPGTVVLNAVVGSISGTFFGVVVCTTLGTLGAVQCYLLSRAAGQSLVEALDRRLMKGKGLSRIRMAVRRYRQDLFVYLLFLRLTPILPNWLVNLASPVVGVPVLVFASATAVGILPQTYLAVRFGALARANKAGGRIVSVWDSLLLIVVACALLMVVRLRGKFETDKGREEDEAATDTTRPATHIV